MKIASMDRLFNLIERSNLLIKEATEENLRAFQFQNSWSLLQSTEDKELFVKELEIERKGI